MYRLIDVESTEPLPSLTLSAEEVGLGCLVRGNDRPIAFFVEALEPGTTLTPEALATLIDGRVGSEIVAADLRDELSEPVSTVELDLTVAVCTRERPELLDRCLSSLTDHCQAGGRVELVVVDNAPEAERTRDVVAGHPAARYVVEPVPGLDMARNRALTTATTSWLAYIDDDCVVDRCWLAGLEEAVSENPDAGAVTGLVLPLELRTDAQVLFEVRGGFRRGNQGRRYGPASAHHSNYPLGAGIFGTGANMAFNVAALRSIGGFDPALDTGQPLPGGGDLDAFYRMIRAGHPLVYAPAMMVRHRHRESLSALRRQYWTWGTGFVAFLHKTAGAEPEMRREVLGMLLWWMRRELGELHRSIRRDDPTPFVHAAAPLAGGVLTGPWKYPRSRRRMKRLAEPGR